ncbi:uncharacterized protein LOC131597901 [Vicia villosa]|uniref:uncharacterized protein LOC131597901 n=1 Tax=Vicia villosa TaxID=3911 RepID=UPI00273B1AD8|nr:uncharacterized protein LOC131597901 [Vicia villosa]
MKISFMLCLTSTLKKYVVLTRSFMKTLFRSSFPLPSSTSCESKTCIERKPFLHHRAKTFPSSSSESENERGRRSLASPSHKTFIIKNKLAKKQRQNRQHHQTAFKEKAGDGVETLDGGTINEIWTDCAGGRSRGRVYGTTDLAINLKKGSTNFVKPAKSSRGSMFRTSLESERAARVRAEQVAEATAARLQEATEAIRVSNEAARRAEEQVKMATEFAKKMESEFDKKMERETNAFKAFIMKTIGTRHGGSTSGVIPPSNPHYDEDLDDQFLDEP